MNVQSSAAAASGPTALFVLLWSSGALFAKWGLAHASTFVFLSLRFGIALALLSLLALAHGHWWPKAGARHVVNVTSLFYLVPAGTAALDWLVLGNTMQPAALAGAAAVIAGVALVYRR